ncbi:MAG: NAD(P)/FAD-dependent oxidoreductase [Rhodospirillaceae bacterium]|nr:NAD(P)/FAD-dependent oxidoreductase [Rhodospirillaceae bacterium]
MTSIRRRGVLAAAIAAPALVGCGTAQARIIVLGGGFAGTSAARALKASNPRLDVTLVEPSNRYFSGPNSNLVVAGALDIDKLSFGYDDLQRRGINVLHESVLRIDHAPRTVLTTGGITVPYDRMIVCPGIDFRINEIEGYASITPLGMPRAWKAATQTDLLRRRLETMEDGGVVAVFVPDMPYRCATAPYERASLIAHWLQRTKPRSKVIVVDAKASFPGQDLFADAWRQLYGPSIEWVGGPQYRVTKVDLQTRTVTTAGGARFTAAVANVIPPQTAGAIAIAAGLTDDSAWCPVDPVTFESLLQKNVHVIGDSADLAPVPKTAFTAAIQGRLAAQAVVDLLALRPPIEPAIANTYYSLLAPDYGISLTDLFRVRGGRYAAIPAASATSPRAADAETRKREADYAAGWFASITMDTWGQQAGH